MKKTNHSLVITKNGTDNMKRKRIITNPFDASHKTMFNEFPKEYTNSIGIPGNFRRKISPQVNLKNGTQGEMDSAYIADPDGEQIFEQVAVGLEHRSVPVDDGKLNKFGDYDIQLVHDHQLPTLIAVASHLNQNKTKKILKRSPSDITKPYYSDLGEENISQKLNNITNIINNNKIPNNDEAINLGVIVLYTPRDRACEITSTVAELYSKIAKDLDEKMEYVLFNVICTMIDAYFDDEKEYQRLIKMMKTATTEKSVEKFDSEIYFIEAYERTKEAYERTTKEYERTKERFDNYRKETEEKIAKLTTEIEQLKGK